MTPASASPAVAAICRYRQRICLRIRESAAAASARSLFKGVGNFNVDAQYSGLNASRFTISVAGIQEDGFAASFSNYGACVLVTAPAVTSSPRSRRRQRRHRRLCRRCRQRRIPPDGLHGTSSATPIVSGVAALMLDANAGARLARRAEHPRRLGQAHRQRQRRPCATAHANENGEWFFNDAANWNGGGMHFSNDYGYGLVDAYAAVRMAEVWSLFARGADQRPTSTFGQHRQHRLADSPMRRHAATLDISLAPPRTSTSSSRVEIDLTHADFTQLRIFLVVARGNRGAALRRLRRHRRHGRLLASPGSTASTHCVART